MSYVETRFGHRFDCDFEMCGEQVEGDSFQDCLQLAKEEGWRFVKLDDRWQHLCPEHKNEKV